MSFGTQRIPESLKPGLAVLGRPGGIPGHELHRRLGNGSQQRPDKCRGLLPQYLGAHSLAEDGVQLGETDHALEQWTKAKALNPDSEFLDKKITDKKLYE